MFHNFLMPVFLQSDAPLTRPPNHAAVWLIGQGMSEEERAELTSQDICSS